MAAHLMTARCPAFPQARLQAPPRIARHRVCRGPSRSREGTSVRPRCAAQQTATPALSTVPLAFERDVSGLERLQLRDSGWNTFFWRGFKTNYITAGESGPPIVLVHGFGANAYHWRYQIPALAKHHRVYAVCLLGYGWSEKASVEYSTELWGDQVADFVRDVVREPALLAGNSVGAVACLAAHAAAPELIRGCALLNAAGRLETPAAPGDAGSAAASEAPMPTGGMKAQLQEAFQRVAAAFIFQSTKLRIGQILQQVYVDRGKVDDDLVRSIYRPACDPAAGEAFFKISGSGARSRRSLNSLLGSLRSPTAGEPAGGAPEEARGNLGKADGAKPLLLVWGMKDPWMKPERASAIMAVFPEAKLVEVDAAGHCPHDDAPVSVNAALLEWAASCA